MTSVVMGTWLTFAPCKPQDREYLAHLMESVEDIPAATIMAGMPWHGNIWRIPRGSRSRAEGCHDVGGLVGHCAVRYWAMGPKSEMSEPIPKRLMHSSSETMAAGALDSPLRAPFCTDARRTAGPRALSQV